MISEILAAYAESVRGSIEHRAATVGASEIGGCLRRTFYAKHAERGPEHFDGWGAALRGTVMEQGFWVPALRARFGDHLKFAGDEQRQLKIGFISATPDALLVGVPSEILSSLGVRTSGRTASCWNVSRSIRG